MSDESPEGPLAPAAPETPHSPTPAPAAPDPERAERNGRNWAVACHLSALLGFAGVPLGHFLGPMILWLIKKDEHPFVEDQGKEALNFQLSVLVYTLASLLLICLCVGFMLLVVLHILNFVLIIVAAVQASSGEPFRYPLTIRFLK